MYWSARMTSDFSLMDRLAAYSSHFEAVYLGQEVIILSSSPPVVRERITVDLPDRRDQLHTRADARFTKLRTHVYEQIQAAKVRTAPAGGGAAG